MAVAEKRRRLRQADACSAAGSRRRDESDTRVHLYFFFFFFRGLYTQLPGSWTKFTSGLPSTHGQDRAVNTPVERAFQAPYFYRQGSLQTRIEPIFTMLEEKWLIWPRVKEQFRRLFPCPNFATQDETTTTTTLLLFSLCTSVRSLARDTCSSHHAQGRRLRIALVYPEDEGSARAGTN